MYCRCLETLEKSNSMVLKLIILDKIDEVFKTKSSILQLVIGGFR